MTGDTLVTNQIFLIFFLAAANIIANNIKIISNFNKHVQIFPSLFFTYPVLSEYLDDISGEFKVLVCSDTVDLYFQFFSGVMLKGWYKIS